MAVVRPPRWAYRAVDRVSPGLIRRLERERVRWYRRGPFRRRPAHEPLYFTLVDANGDGLDDSLEQATNLPGGPPPVDDGSWYHDHGHGGGH